MKTSFLFFFLFFSLCAFSQSSDKSPGPIRLSAIPFPYTLLDAPGQFKVLSENSILMSAGKETDLHNPADGSYFRHNAPKFLFKPDANFEFSAKVKPTFTKLYDGGAILLYSDEDNWAKVLLQYIDDKPILGISVIKDKITDDSYFIPATKDVYLRVSKKGRVFNFLTSPDGKQWRVIREFVYHKPENIRIGFYSQSPMGSECAVEFSEITYNKILGVK
jgi:uncharacterized protein